MDPAWILPTLLGASMAAILGMAGKFGSEIKNEVRMLRNEVHLWKRRSDAAIAVLEDEVALSSLMLDEIATEREFKLSPAKVKESRDRIAERRRKIAYENNRSGR